MGKGAGLLLWQVEQKAKQMGWDPRVAKEQAADLIDPTLSYHENLKILKEQLPLLAPEGSEKWRAEYEKWKDYQKQKKSKAKCMPGAGRGWFAKTCLAPANKACKGRKRKEFLACVREEVAACKIKWCIEPW